MTYKIYLYNPNENTVINTVKIISKGTNMLITAAHTINGPNGIYSLPFFRFVINKIIPKNKLLSNFNVTALTIKSVPIKINETGKRCIPDAGCELFHLDGRSR